MSPEPTEFLIEQLRRVILSLGWAVTATQITPGEIIVTVSRKIT